MRPAMLLSGEIFHLPNSDLTEVLWGLPKVTQWGKKKKKKKLYSQKEHREEWKLKICHLAVLNVSDKNVCHCDSLLDDTSIRGEQRASGVVWVNKRRIMFHLVELGPDLAAKKKKRKEKKSHISGVHLVVQ